MKGQDNNSIFSKQRQQKCTEKHISKRGNVQYSDEKQQQNRMMKNNKKKYQFASSKKGKKDIQRVDSRSKHNRQSNNTGNYMNLAGIKVGLHMVKLSAKQISSGLVSQKDNPIPISESNNYPKEAMPRVIPPDTSLQLISSKSGKQISELFTAFNEGSSDDYVSFDEAIEYVRACEELQEGQEIQYVGSGKFAIVEFETENNIKHMKIIYTVDFETMKDIREWREKLQYQVTFIEIESVTPLSELYTQEEIDSFREFNDN